MATKLTLKDLQSYVENQVPENLNLDYKACEALNKNNPKRSESLSKDVSAFANSAGGVLIYGIKEKEESGYQPPEKIDDGFDSATDGISPESLTQMINANIQPRVPGVLVYPVDLENGRFALVVDVPQSHMAPHQASDKRYYKRHNSESLPMEDYEIKDVMNRQRGPDLEIIFKKLRPERPRALPKRWQIHPLIPFIKNNGFSPSDTAIITFWISHSLYCSPSDDFYRPPFKDWEWLCHPQNGMRALFNNEEKRWVKGQVCYQRTSPLVYGSQPQPLRKDECFNWQQLPQSNSQGYIVWQIEAPHMVAKQGYCAIFSDGNIENERIEIETPLLQEIGDPQHVDDSTFYLTIEALGKISVF